MFLIESTQKSILITGDIRAEKDWVESLPRNESLFPYTTSLKKLDNIYLDTTFGYRSEPFIDMKPNYFGLQALTEVLKFYPMDDNAVSFHFADSTIGYEDLWIRITNLFDGKLHSSKELHKRLEMLSNANDYEYKCRIGDINSQDPESKFHCCGTRADKCTRSMNKFTVRLKHSIDISYQDMLNITHPLPWDQFKGSAVFEEELPQGHKIYRIDDIPHLLPKSKDYLLRNEIRFFFSRHSSYDECRYFMSLFNVDDVYPLTESPKSWGRGFQMQRVFGDLLNKNENFLYDDLSSKIYGSAPTGLEKPMTINKFSESFLKSLTDESRAIAQPSAQFPFKGITNVHNAAFRQSFTEDEMQFMAQRYDLIREGRVLTGVNQYRVERGIRTMGPQFLNRYRDREHSQRQHDTQTSESEDEDNLEAAIQRFNRTRSNLAPLDMSFNQRYSLESPNPLSPLSPRVLKPSPKIITTKQKSADTHAKAELQKITKPYRPAASSRSPKIINLDSQQDSVVFLKSAVNLKTPRGSNAFGSMLSLKPLSPQGSRIQQELQSDIHTAVQMKIGRTQSEASEWEHNTASFWRRRITASPVTPKRQGQYTNINLDNVLKISQSVMNADGKGFFDYNLKSCQKN